MNDKEIGEIRRQLRRDRSNITAIYGCYVNAARECCNRWHSIAEKRIGLGLSQRKAAVA